MTDYIRYDILAQNALRNVVRTVMADAAKKGLPGEHHFKISFDTMAPGAKLSPRLREQYPQEMTIVLQHQFWDLCTYGIRSIRPTSRTCAGRRTPRTARPFQSSALSSNDRRTTPPVSSLSSRRAGAKCVTMTPASHSVRFVLPSDLVEIEDTSHLRFAGMGDRDVGVHLRPVYPSDRAAAVGWESPTRGDALRMIPPGGIIRAWPPPLGEARPPTRATSATATPRTRPS